MLAGKDMQSVSVLEAAPSDGLSVVADNNGLIHAIGTDSEINASLPDCNYAQEVDASGMCVLPGLVDAHTHPVWAGDRVHEFSMKLAGATYMDIHSKGGGIGYTVRCTCQASEEELYASLSSRFSAMLKNGTTLVEAKSGYGLDKENEVKMLKVIERARRDHTIGISSTYCGAHSIPSGSTMEQATTDIIDVQIPHIGKLMQSGDLVVDSIDVFCEKGVFDLDNTRRILLAGKAINLPANFHGDELHPMNAAELSGEIGARAISHLEEVSDDGIAAMATAQVVAVLLPTTAYVLRLKCPPARRMIDKGVAVALGSDFNPNAFCMSMPMVMNLACVTLRLTMPEALIGATLNAAAALGKSDRFGSIEIGKVADFIIVNATRYIRNMSM